MLIHLQLKFIYVFIAILFATLLSPMSGEAAYNEQLAIDPVSIGLANTVTARPPGIAAVHFNPAGLTKLPEGKTKASGMLVGTLRRQLKPTMDPEFEGFMNTFGPGEDKRPDPLSGIEGTNSSLDLFLPFINTLHYNPVLVMPQSAQAYKKPGSKWAFGRAVIAPFSGGFSHKKANDPNRYFAKELILQRINYLSPGAGYQVSDSLSVGITVAAGMTNFRLFREIRSPSHMTALTKILGEATEELEIPVLSEETLPPPWFGGGISPWETMALLNIEMNDWFSPSYNFGILWEPSKYFTFGAVYQSPIRNELSGNFILEYAPSFQRMVEWQGSSPLLRTNSAVLDLPTNPVRYQKGNITMEFEYPQRVQMGIMIRPVKKIRLMCDLHWANWSTFHEQHLDFDRDIQAFQIAKLSGHTHGNRATAVETGLEDTFHWSYGAEIDLSPTFCLRLGYEFRPSSVPIEYFSAGSIPDMHRYACGFGVKMKNGATLDVGYSYGDTGDYYIPNDTSQNLNSLNFTKSSSSPYAGSDVNFRMAVHFFSFSISKPVTIPEETAVRKIDKFKNLKKNIRHLFKSLNPFRKDEK